MARYGLLTYTCWSEAGTGIEPVMEDLQSSALPLGHPAGAGEG